MDASVIIPTYNRRDWVRRAVGALTAQDYPPSSFEVIIVCDRVTDGTEEALNCAYGNRVSILRSSSPGQVPALNEGVARARGDVLIFIDDEMEPEPNFVAAHVAAHRTRFEEVAVTGYSPVIVDRRASAYTRMVAAQYESYHARLSEPERTPNANDLNGGNFSIRALLLRQLGGFNQNYPFERNDFELAVRLMMSGGDIVFCKEAMAPQRLAITEADVIGHAIERARTDLRLAIEYPCCRPFLPFNRVLTRRAVRRRWRALWELAPLTARAARIARTLAPRNVTLANVEYAARYCMGLRMQAGDWQSFLSYGAEP